MRRPAAAALLAWASCAPLPEAAPLPDLTLRLELQDGHYVFIAEGRAEAESRARVYVHAGPDDDEPLDWAEDGKQPVVRILPGPFRAELGRFVRKPRSLRYRVYLQRGQDVDETDRHADLSLGDATTLAAEEEELTREAAEDFAELRRLYASLLHAIDAPPDPAAWARWKADWEPRRRAIDARNATRWGLWAVWRERRIQLRVSGLAELLRRLAARAEEDELHDLPERRRYIEAYFEDTADEVRIPEPPSPELFARLAAFEGAAVRGQRGAGLEALLRLIPFARKHGYPYVNDVARHFTRRLEDVEAQGDLDRAVAELKAFLGAD